MKENAWSAPGDDGAASDVAWPDQVPPCRCGPAGGRPQRRGRRRIPLVGVGLEGLSRRARPSTGWGSRGEAAAERPRQARRLPGRTKSQRGVGRGAGLLAPEESRAELHGPAPSAEGRRHAAAVGDPTGGDHRGAHRVDHAANERPSCRPASSASAKKGTAVPAGLHARRDIMSTPASSSATASSTVGRRPDRDDPTLARCLEHPASGTPNTKLNAPGAPRSTARPAPRTRGEAVGIRRRGDPGVLIKRRRRSTAAPKRPGVISVRRKIVVGNPEIERKRRPCRDTQLGRDSGDRIRLEMMNPERAQPARVRNGGREGDARRTRRRTGPARSGRGCPASSSLVSA